MEEKGDCTILLSDPVYITSMNHIHPQIKANRIY